MLAFPEFLAGLFSADCIDGKGNYFRYKLKFGIKQAGATTYDAFVTVQAQALEGN